MTAGGFVGMARYEDLPYRTCVGMMLINAAGLVFIGRRAGGIEHLDESHVWQMPQGGVDRGQRQKWYAVRFTGEDAEINVASPGGGHKAEFVGWRWEPMKNLPNLIVPFKRPVYERVVKEFSKLADG
jgi:putative (di)nucleoside polyphosphate hydrolase